MKTTKAAARAYLRCFFSHPFRSLHAAREVMTVAASSGVHSTVENCLICGNFHIRIRKP